MAFIVEDGTRPPGANSFASVEFFTSYCTDRGYTVPLTWDSSRMQVNLVRATDYLNARYRLSVSGFPISNDQELMFPRYQCRKKQGADGYGVNTVYGALDTYVPSSTVPIEVQKAVCELALTADSGQLMPDISREEWNTVSEKIGPITTDYSGKYRLAFDLFRHAAMLMAPYLAAVGSGVKMVRS